MDKLEQILMIIGAAVTVATVAVRVLYKIALAVSGAVAAISWPEGKKWTSWVIRALEGAATALVLIGEAVKPVAITGLKK